MHGARMDITNTGATIRNVTEVVELYALHEPVALWSKLAARWRASRIGLF
jgi:hypothetical protein